MNKSKKRRQPDVRNIKKHSQIVKARTNELAVGGQRERTNYGYKIPGFRGKTFETKYETMLAGTSTNFVRHDKKDRAIRVLAGRAIVITMDTEGKVNEQTIYPGDEIGLERGTSYRITTMSNENLEMLISQSAAYESALKVVEKCEITKEVADELLKPQSEYEVVKANRPDLAQPQRRGSKAVEQLQAERSEREESAQIVKPVDSASSPESAASATDKNPKPTGGRFDEAGAG